MKIRKKLFGAYDLHKTLKHIVTIPQPPKVPANWVNFYPSLSLFEKIPEERTCITARIPPNHCFCEPWKEPWEESRTMNDPQYSWLVNKMMDFINNEAGILARLCPQFTFDTVDLVAWKEPTEEPGKRYWMVEVTMKEGHPNRYVMNLEQPDKLTDDGKIISVKQITRYWMYQKCAPRGASPEFCVCK